MTRLSINALLPLFSLVFLSGCFGGGSEGTGIQGTGGIGQFPSEDDPMASGFPLEGLTSCIPEFNGQSLLCGSVTLDDGVTPLAGVEVRLDSDMSLSPSGSNFSSRGIADENQCLTNSLGEYACVIPSDISGVQIFILIPPNTIDFEPRFILVDVQAGDITIAEPLILSASLRDDV